MGLSEKTRDIAGVLMRWECKFAALVAQQGHCGSPCVSVLVLGINPPSAVWVPSYNFPLMPR